MPIIIPKAEPMVGIPGGIQAPEIQPNYGVGNSLLRIGATIKDQEDRIQTQHDIAVAQDETTQFRLMAQNEMQKHTSRMGRDAVGSIGEYQEWYNKTSGDIQAKLSSTRQQLMFKRAANATMLSDLNRLSTHQAQQHKMYLGDVAKGVMSTGEREILANPDDPMTYETQLTMAKTAMENAFPGTDVSSEMEGLKQKWRIAALSAIQDPVKKQAKLEEWKGDLGDKWAQVKDSVDKDAIYRNATDNFPGNYDAQMKFVEGIKNISDDVKYDVSTRIRVLKNDEESRVKKAYIEGLKNHYNQIDQMILNGDYKKAFEYNRAANWIEPSDKLAKENSILALSKGGKDPFDISDDAILEKSIEAATKGELDPKMIIPVPGKISIKHANMLRGIAERSIKDEKGEDAIDKTNARNAVKGVLKSMWGTDKNKALLLGEKLTQLEDYMTKNPNADYMKYVKDDLLKEESGWAVGKWLKDTFGSGVNKEPDERQQAIEELKKQGAVVTDKRIDYVIQQMKKTKVTE